MRWCSDKELSALLALPDGYTVERLRTEDIELLSAALQEWYPDISVGIGSVYLDPTFYRRYVALQGDELNDVAVWVFRHLGSLVAMWSDERIPQSLSIYGRLIVVSPAHRSVHIGARIIATSASRAAAQGAEYMFANATLKTPIIQSGLERAGYRLIGLAPGADREREPDGTVKRVYEAVYALSLAPSEACAMPAVANLTPRVRQLFDTLFGSDGCHGAA